MPSAQIIAIAKKVGKEADAEKLWAKAIEQAKGVKLKDGSTISKNETAWGDAEFKYVMGVFKKMIGIKEADLPALIASVHRLKESSDDRRFRVVLDGDTVQMVHEGVVVHEGEDTAVDQTRKKVQELLNGDHAVVFDLHGSEGTLAELETKVFTDWFLFCMDGHVATPIGIKRVDEWQGRGQEKVTHEQLQDAYSVILRAEGVFPEYAYDFEKIAVSLERLIDKAWKTYLQRGE